ncbi:hypothetical protein DFA_05485 [Cavenderia fasciculata]|uniref:THH1/TOM1/TOM3 domain-containing protein n=1 Tax=Cavenderia fasciculata TaxID=261658 RepID=F4PLD1_CACFS|nr:uncharacterized protein DFA_05485 [Cavenderia fasciculata]EGG23353.1 hypothetical protein DFA_05485 [Cavenderia fasciculata]|eukprot:XP_004361204.1 hypothetical protein DFA_05485 [Cavenderia fasciculata]
MKVKQYYDYLFVVTILLFLILVTGTVKGELSNAKLVSSNYTLKTVDIVGGKVELVTGELVFDRELFRLQSTVCANDTNCVLPVCPPCDYTTDNPNGCGVVDPSCPPTSTCPLASQLCDLSLPMNQYEIISQFDTPLLRTTPGTVWMESISRYRFYIGSTCKAYKFHLDIVQGDLFSATFYINPANGSIRHHFSNTQRDITVTMCPTDTRLIDTEIDMGNYGTQFLEIINTSPDDAKYIIQIDTFDMNPVSIPPPTCSQIISGIQCLNNGMTIPDNGTPLTVPRTYSFTIDKCENITVQHQYATSGYPDIYVKIEDASVSNQKFDYKSPGQTHEQIVFQLCPNTGNNLKTIFIALYPTIVGQKSNVFVSTGGIMQSVPLTQVTSIQSGTWMLAGTSTIILNQTRSLHCHSFGFDCYDLIPSTPRLFSNPLYPVPDIYLNQSLSEFQHLELNEETNPMIKNTYQFGIIISSRYYQYSISNNSWIKEFIKDGNNVMVQLLDNLVDDQGNVVSGNYSLGDSKTPLCNHTAFKEIDSEQEGLIEAIEDSVNEHAVQRVRYQFDLLMMRDSYFLCESLAQQMIHVEQTKKFGNSTACLDPGNRLDPCCTFSALYNHSCGPTEGQWDRTEFKEVLGDMVSESCVSPSCVTSLLRNYAQTYLGRQSSACAVEQKEVYDATDPMYNLFRFCHQNTTLGVRCKQNADCSVLGSSARCNPRDGQCMAPYRDIELAFVTCLVNIVPPSTLVDFLAKYNISQDDNSTMISFTHAKFSTNKDCVTPYTIDKNTRQSYRYVTPDGTVPRYCYRGINSFDRSDVLQSYDTCYQGDERFMWTASDLAINNCTDFYKCDWMGSQGTLDAFYGNVGDLGAACNSPAKPTSFCGECDTDPTRNCYVDNTLDATTCPTKFACYHPTPGNPLDPEKPVTFTQPNSNFETADSADQCRLEHGSCNVPCGLKCSARQSCVIPLAPQETVCLPTLYGGVLDAQVTVPTGEIYCSYYSTNGSLSQAQCQFTGSFTDCNAFNSLGQQQLVQQCGVCGANGNFKACACKLEVEPCKTMDQCKSAGGACTDMFYFVNEIAGYPPGQPKCLFGQPKVVDASHIATLPQCAYGKEQESPIGCFSVNTTFIGNSAACTAAGGTLWQAATNQLQCRNRYPDRCLSVDRSETFIPPLSRRYMDKPQDDCNNGKILGDNWRPTFAWVPAQWTNGTAVPLSWRTTQGMVPIAQLNYSFSYQSMFEAFQGASTRRLALTFKSEMLCRSSLSKSTLIPFSCSCGVDNDENDADTCFNIQNDPIDTIIKPCTLDAATFPLGDDEGSKGNITFSLGAVRGYICVSVGIGQIFSDSLKAKQVVALSSDFVPSLAPPDYSVFNDNGGVVGKALADGLILRIFDKGINNFDLCIIQSISSSSEFPKQDFAILVDEQKGIVHPLECETTQGGGATCCNIKSNTLPEPVGTNKILLIQRTNDWKKKNYQSISSSNQAVVYTLGALFLVPFIIGSIEVVYFIYAHFFKKLEVKVVHILFVFLTIFSFIRGIYFIILGSGVLKDNANVADYILVVLPTFLYFTAFTIVIIIWYILSRDSMQRVDNIYKRINRLIIGVNILLYLLFIGIVLVFNFYIGDPPPTCNGRVSAGYENSTPQRVVSILYASIQAILSGALGLSFIYYGRKVIQKLSHFKQNLVNANNQMKKTVSMAIICSVGFLLHCIFIIILVTVKPKNVVFSFIGLVVTEIVPVMTLLFNYTQVPFGLSQVFLKDKSIKDNGNEPGGVELQSNTSTSSSYSSSVSSSTRSKTMTVRTLTQSQASLNSSAVRG